MARRLAAKLCALAIVLGSSLVSSGVVRAVDATEVTISCSDGSAMTGPVTLATLAELVQEAQSMIGCTLSQDPSLAVNSTDQTGWTVYDYNPSDQAIKPRNSAASMPATTSGDTTTFAFRPDIFTALLVTTDKELTGDLTTKTLSADISVHGNAGAFEYQRGCTGGGTPGTVRFYFRSPRASGSSDPAPGSPVMGGLPPAGFYTQFWWSNPIHVDLAIGTQTPVNITARMADPAEWSDWDGKPAADPLVTDQFLVAIANVKTIGFSFGGGCGFENGVTFDYATGSPPPYEMFVATFDEL